MNYLTINNNLKISQIVLGCMRISNMSIDELEKLILCAIDEGINFFDHADIYGAGKGESLFGEVLKRNPELRNKMIIQTKCGICKGYYDFSKEHIINSVNNSLKRLNTEYIDILLLHRPDTLMDLNEVKDAFNQLSEEGKVKYFGVSNMNSMQIEFMQKNLSQKLLFNQVHFNPVNAGMIDSGIFVNMKDTHSVDHDGSLLEYCRLKDITLQAWSILQASWEEGCFLDHPNYPELNNVLQKYADKYNVSKACISTAWILRHPAGIQAIAGTTNINHLKDLCKACNITLTRKEWYEIYLSTGKILP